MYSAPPVGITPHTPGLEHEEPEFGLEDDIPVEDQTADRETEAKGGDGLREVERE